MLCIYIESVVYCLLQKRLSEMPPEPVKEAEVEEQITHEENDWGKYLK